MANPPDINAQNQPVGYVGALWNAATTAAAATGNAAWNVAAATVNTGTAVATGTYHLGAGAVSGTTRTVSSVYHAVGAVNDVCHEGLGNKVEGIIRQGVAAANEPAHPTLFNGLRIARELQQALSSETPGNIAPIREQLSNTIQEILNLPQPPEGNPRRLSNEHRETLTNLHTRLGQPYNAENRQELQNQLRDGIQILLAQQGLTDQINHVVQEVLVPIQKTVTEIKEQVTGRPQQLVLLAGARDALLKLKEKITYCAVKRTDLTRYAEELNHVINSRGFTDTMGETARDEFILLDSILGRLENAETADADLPRKEEVIPILKRAYEILDQYIHEHSGMVTRISNDATQLEHKFLVNGPMDAWNFHRGNNPEVGPIIIAPPGDNNGSSTLMDYLWAMSSQLSTYLQSDEGHQAISKQVITSMGSALLMTLNGALTSVRGRENFDPICAKIEELIARINDLMTRANAGNPATLTELYTIIGDSMSQLNSVTIYINNLFRVPRLGRGETTVNSLETPFLSNISKLKKTATTPAEGTAYWKKKATKEKDKFINNTKNFLILKIIYEKVCGLETSDQFYLDIISEISAQNGADVQPDGVDNDPLLREANEARLLELNNTHLRTALFNKLGGANRELAKVSFGGIRKRLAPVAYTIVSYFLNKFMHNLGTSYLDEAFDYIKENKLLSMGQRANLIEGDEEIDANNAEEESVLFNSLKSTLVENFTRYLMASNGSYRRIANNPIPNETLPKMRQKELARPEINAGATSEELYGSFAKLVIGKCMNNDILAWLFRHLIGGQEAVIEGIIDQSVGSIMDANGYTHALNTVFVDLLKDILQLMKDNEETGAHSRMPTYQDADSRQNKAKMTALVKNLFEILEKNKCQTQDDLIALFKDQSLSHNLTKMGDDLFMEDVIESVADVLTLAIRELVTEEKLYKLIDQFTGLVNTVYQTGHNYSRRDVKEKEIELSHLTNQLLSVSISSAVKKKFDFMGGHEHTEANKQIDLLRQETQKLVGVIDLDGLGQSIQNDNPILIHQLQTIADTTCAYLERSKLDRFNSQGSQLGSDNIDKLDRIYRTADENATHFVTHISAMLKAQKEIDVKNRVTPRVDDIRRITDAIPARFAGGHSLQNIDLSEREILELEGHLRGVEQITQNRNISALRNSFTTLATSLQGLRNRVTTIQFYGSLFVQEPAQPGNPNGALEPPLLAQILRERQEHMLCPDSVKEKIQVLKNRIPVCLDPAVRRQLIIQLDNIQNSVISHQINDAHDLFIHIAQAAQATAEDIAGQKQLINRDCQRIQAQLGNLLEILEDNYIPERREIIRRSFPEAQRGLTQIRRSYIHSGLLDAEKSASDLISEIEKKAAGLEGLPEEQRENKLAEIRGELAPKIAAVDTALHFLAANGPVIFHNNGEIGLEANLRNEDILANTDDMLRFGVHWRNGLPNDLTLADAKGQVQTLLTRLKRLKIAQSTHNTFAPTPYYNINVSDMHSAKDLITGVVFKRVRERADGLIDLVSSEEFYRYGLLHHMFLIPYLQHNNAMPKPKKSS